MQYIGDKEISKSLDEGGLVKVQFKDGSEIHLTSKMFNASVSEEPLDASLLQDKRVTAMSREIMHLLVEWDIEMGDLRYLLDFTFNSTENYKKLCEEYLWGNKLPNVKLSRVNEVLQQLTDKEKSNA